MGAGKTITLVHKGYAIKVILSSNQNFKYMNIIKRFARWVLREDWEIASARIRILQNDLRERNEKIDNLQHQLNDWRIKMNLNESSILPQSAVKSVIDCLPNPNDAAIGKLSARKSDIYFSHVVRGRNVKHLVRLEKFYSINDVIHAQVKIHDLNISITLSLKRHKLNYTMLGVNSEVETYYWDFNFSNIKIISDDVFDLISEFIIAQRNVLTEL